MGISVLQVRPPVTIAVVSRRIEEDFLPLSEHEFLSHRFVKSVLQTVVFLRPFSGVLGALYPCRAAVG